MSERNPARGAPVQLGSAGRPPYADQSIGICSPCATPTVTMPPNAFWSAAVRRSW